ncbi:Stk1 family PASTA domain-containing Ser/Thr kinase [Propionimicrobium sp. PCR01-08-3]|uniref:Stk1 family PASTA domain-containing Ser/Thr kinase n=1 Tax=Propionimicrobium sp. PCR01-08-3 TaxID=3052086 RepID=UPI00255D0EF4|nr:Stk1 family PASTA domain-containing Ser/Thr kinase [Propionimicrobium sp. PCR01-08-3]WIY82769.1 Stk1 family PASTA domain-containing Ser/Thr kinase [Propionimicrobium sp. PCR01-08-3]
MTDEPVILGGRYQLETIIGRGGMAEVWRANDTRLGRPVAIKRLRVDLATDSTFQKRFQREAQSAAGLNHPNIVSVYDTDEQLDPASGVSVPYIVMELVEGHTLRELLREGEPISAQRSFEYEIGVLDALSYSHKHDIVHRDIKPANVMLTNSGQIKVMDFGIARAVSDTSATMTQTAAVIGTAQYLSPEQARGEQVDARSDLYSAGCLLYELLTGRPPFLGDSPVSVAYQHVREMPIPPSQLNPDITPEMDAVTMKALAKRTDDRYQSAKQMRDDCWRLLNGQAVTAQLSAAAVSETRATRALPVELDPEYDPAGYDNEAQLETAASEVVDADDIDEQPKKRRISPATGVLIGLLVVLLGVLGFFALRMSGLIGNNDVQVPTVTGSLQDAAVDQLETVQLQANVQHQTGPAEGKGTVVSQDPAAGETVLVGSTVTIVINDGPPVSPIPSGVVGAMQDEAVALLKDAGFTNVEPMDAPASLDTVGAKEGEVVAVDPEEGTEASTDEKVTLYVASGRSELPGDIIGMQDADARALLEGAGYTNVTSDYLEPGDSDEPIDYQRGQVVYAVPATGSTVENDSPIVLWLASGESVMPNLVGMTKAEATAKLEALGLTSVTFSPADGKDDAKVTAQDQDVDKVLRRSENPAIKLTLEKPASSSPSSSKTP